MKKPLTTIIAQEINTVITKAATKIESSIINNIENCFFFFIPKIGMQSEIRKHRAEPNTEDMNNVMQKIRNRLIER